MNITKREAKELLDLETDAELARFFDIGRWAVGQWAEDEPMPRGRTYELVAKRPELFKTQIVKTQ